MYLSICFAVTFSRFKASFIRAPLLSPLEIGRIAMIVIHHEAPGVRTSSDRHRHMVDFLAPFVKNHDLSAEIMPGIL